TNANGLSAPSDSSNAVIPGVGNAVPDPPGLPTVTPGDGLLSVTFSTVNHGSAPIDLYAASCVSDDGGVGKSAASGSLRVIVGGVTKGKPYTSRGQAANANGASLLGTTSAPAFVPPIPDPPDSVVASADDTDLSVSFDPGNDYGHAVSAFAVTCEP